MSIDVINVMAKYNNICNHIHLPVQSGSNKILKAMNRQHSKEEYIDLINRIKQIIKLILNSLENKINNNKVSLGN